jgi:hypothetical protein
MEAEAVLIQAEFLVALPFLYVAAGSFRVEKPKPNKVHGPAHG